MHARDGVFCCGVTSFRKSTPSARKIARTSVFIKADLPDVIDAFVSGYQRKDSFGKTGHGFTALRERRS
jgi:hypothetical protein